MLTIFFIVAGVMAVAVVVFLVVASVQPVDFKVTRSAMMEAPPAVVYAQVNDLHRWQAWSPWAKLDPAAKNSFAGPEAGIGSSMSWAGNNKVGAGKMTITANRPEQQVFFSLEFYKPFVATNVAEFDFKASGAGTMVTWSMSGKNSFMGKVFSLLMDCDKMVGGQFEKGLADLKMITEAEAGK